MSGKYPKVQAKLEKAGKRASEQAAKDITHWTNLRTPEEVRKRFRDQCDGLVPWDDRASKNRLSQLLALTVLLNAPNVGDKAMQPKGVSANETRAVVTYEKTSASNTPGCNPFCITHASIHPPDPTTPKLSAPRLFIRGFFPETTTPTTGETGCFRETDFNWTRNGQDIVVIAKPTDIKLFTPENTEFDVAENTEFNVVS